MRQWNLHLDQVIQSSTAQIRFFKPTTLLTGDTGFKTLLHSPGYHGHLPSSANLHVSIHLHQSKSTNRLRAGQDLLYRGFLRAETHQWDKPLRKRWYKWTQPFSKHTKLTRKNNFHLNFNNHNETGSGWNIYIKWNLPHRNSLLLCSVWFTTDLLPSTETFSFDVFSNSLKTKKPLRDKAEATLWPSDNYLCLLLSNTFTQKVNTIALNPLRLVPLKCLPSI